MTQRERVSEGRSDDAFRKRFRLLSRDQECLRRRQSMGFHVMEAGVLQLPAQLREDILTTKLDVAQMADLEHPEEKLPEFAHPSER